MIHTGANSLMGIPTGRFDGHTHVFKASLPMAQNRRYTPGYDAKPEDLRRLLAAHGLDGALLVQPSFLGADNGYLLDVLRTYAGHRDVIFKGVVVLDPAIPVDSGWLRALDALGVIGVRLNLVRKVETFSYNDWRAALCEIEKLNWHVELHCESCHIDRVLAALCARHQKVVIDHFGLVKSPDDDAGFRAIIAQHPERVWIKFSGAYRIFPDADRNKDAETTSELQRRYFEKFGPDRLIWGSDWPFTQYEDCVSYAQTIGLCR